MATELKAGGLDSFQASMAKAMEDALNQLLIAEGKPPVPTENTTETRDRRIMFVAIARGIVNHLKANQAAFTIRQNDGITVLNNHNVHIE